MRKKRAKERHKVRGKWSPDELARVLTAVGSLLRGVAAVIMAIGFLLL
jgi:hypothetical protein